MRKNYWLHGLLLLGTAGLIGCGTTDDEAADTSANTAQITDTAETSVDTSADTSVDTSTGNHTSEVEAQYTTSINQDLLDQHENRHQEIMEEFQNGGYTLEEPFVIQDPYDRAPLSALVLFETDELMEVTVTVDGQREDMSISHTYAGYETSHEVPVLGLYPDMENQVTISGETEDGESAETNLVLETGSVPEGLLDLTVETAEPNQMEDGLTFISPSRAYPAGVDVNGDVRWYTSVQSSNQFKRLENGNVLLATLEEEREDYDTLTEMNMLGRVYQSIEFNMENQPSSRTLHHDTIVLDNGNYLALIHDGGEEYVEDEMAEIDRETGEVVHRINFRDIFPAPMYEDYTGSGEEDGDWIHINAVWQTEDDESLLLSLRQQDTILKMSYPEGEIEWLLGYPEGWPEEVEDYLLAPVDESVRFPGGQHAVEELPDQDGNEDTMDILMFDNNRIISRGEEEGNEEYSRAVQYRIDESADTVEEVWSYGEERGTDFYSGIVSDADYLPESGNVLINSGRIESEEAENESSSLIVEVTKTEDPEVVFELRYGPYPTDDYTQIYRAERMSLYPEEN